MRVLVLVVAMVFSAGSIVGGIGGGRGSARQGYAVSTVSCNYVVDPVQKQACYNRANVQYAVASQQEMVEDQNARAEQQAAAQQQQAAYDSSVRRCESIVRAMMTCQMLLPADAVASRNYCLTTLVPTATAHGYGQTLCYEQATTCDQMKWCLSH